MDRSILNRETGLGIAGDAVSEAGNDRAEQSRERSEHRNGKNIAVGDVDLAAPLHQSRIVAYAGEIVDAAQLPMSCFVTPIKIGQTWEIERVDRQLRCITLIVVSQRNVGGSAHVPGK